MSSTSSFDGPAGPTGPTPAPQWSPDGQWWWNGATWVPAAQAPVVSPPAPPGALRRPIRPAVLVGLVVLLVLGVVAGVAGYRDNAARSCARDQSYAQLEGQPIPDCG